MASSGSQLVGYNGFGGEKDSSLPAVARETKWDGTLDKYVGDEIMALWNAPLPQPNHALLAIRCAYDLVSAAPALQAKLAARGLPPIGWGIGINSGAAVVGNMGSQDRLQYTALGDTVNTAARLESNSIGGQILVSDATARAATSRYPLKQRDPIFVKNRAQPVPLFEVEWESGKSQDDAMLDSLDNRVGA